MTHSSGRKIKWAQFTVTAVAIALVFASTPAKPDTVSCRPSADTYIREFDPDPTMTYGTSAIIAAGCLGTRNLPPLEIRRGLIRFDLTGLVPAGALINSVSVTVTVIKAPQSDQTGASVASIFDLRRMLQPWGENEANWNSRLSGATWQSPGANGAQDAASSASSAVF